MIETYVAGGLGIGLAVQPPRPAWPAGVRALALPGFPGVKIGGLWRGKKSSCVDAFLDMARRRAREMF